MRAYCALIIGLGLAFPASADMTIVQKMKSAQPAGMPAQTQTIYVKNKKAKIDLGGVYLLVDLEERKIYWVFPFKKELSVTPSVKWGASGNVAKLTGKTPTVKKTGQTKTISGFKCIQYIWSIAMPNSVDWVVDYWVTESLDPKEFAPFVPFTHQDFELPNIEDLQLIKGFPIRTEMKFVDRRLPGHVSEEIGYTTEVQTITHDPIPDSTLSIPKGFHAPAAARACQFAGTWNVVLSGSLKGRGQVNISKACSIYFQPVVLQDNRVELTGSVSDSGKLAHGMIFKDNSQIGTLIGNFSGKNGGGTYQLDNGGNGNWSADKQ